MCRINMYSYVINLQIFLNVTAVFLQVLNQNPFGGSIPQYVLKLF